MVQVRQNLLKCYKTSNLSEKIAKLRREAPDTQIISRIKIERHGKAREITKELNTKNGSYSRDGKYDIIEWSSDPTYLETFKGWDFNGNHK